MLNRLPRHRPEGVNHSEISLFVREKPKLHSSGERKKKLKNVLRERKKKKGGEEEKRTCGELEQFYVDVWGKNQCLFAT